MPIMPDIKRSFRYPATYPTEFQQEFRLLGDIAVGVIPTRLSPLRIPVTSAFIQASKANANLIALGDSNVTLTSGLQLAAGEAYLLTPDQLTAPAEIQAAGGVFPILIINLADLWLLGSIAGLTARCFFVLPPKSI